MIVRAETRGAGYDSIRILAKRDWNGNGLKKSRLDTFKPSRKGHDVYDPTSANTVCPIMAVIGQSA